MLRAIRFLPRLYVAAALSKGRSFALSPQQTHYLQNVMRLRTGDALRLFNGRDGEWQGTISHSSKRAVEMTTNELLRPQLPEPDLWLCCTPIKKSYFDYMLEKATELGVSAIYSVLTDRTQVRAINVERCRLIGIEAAEQSERLHVPDIKKPVTLKELIKLWPGDRAMIVCAEWGDAMPLQAAFGLPMMRLAHKAGVLVGPEGGFTAEEFDALKDVPSAVCVRLGPRILRADTAAIAALSCWQGMRGDWL
jgi:16S rRNA (uracil1498-N3)-methyltransferase